MELKAIEGTMNAVSGFIFLLSLIASCHFFPLTEFDIDFQETEKLYQVSYTLDLLNVYKNTY